MITRSLSKPRKEPRQKRSGQTVEAILQATAHILVQKGYDAVTTNHVAVKAGVSIGSLYQYFPNKESIIAALYESHEREIIQILKDKFAQAPLDQPLDLLVAELVDAMLETHRHNPRLHQILHEQVPRVGGVLELEKVALQIVAAELGRRARQVKCCNYDLAAFVIVHAVEAITHKAVTQRVEYLKSPALAEEIVRLVLRYLTLPV